MSKKTLVIGASANPMRYSNRAVRRLLENNIEVHAIGRFKTTIDGIEVQTEQNYIKDIHTIALYINPLYQKQFYDYIVKLKPKRIIFNPGTHNDELKKLARENDIEVVEDCVLVMLRSNSY
ncbi:MAG: CoA-binding protein [Bacteroidota bacterium]